jgi:effector-binding domain-containing protein
MCGPLRVVVPFIGSSSCERRLSSMSLRRGRPRRIGHSIPGRVPNGPKPTCPDGPSVARLPTGPKGRDRRLWSGRPVASTLRSGREHPAAAPAEPRLVWRKRAMDYVVSTREVPEQPIISIRERIGPSEISSFLGRSFADLYGHVGLLGVAPSGHPFVIYHEFGTEAIDAEVCVPLAHEIRASGRIESRILEPATVAQTLHVGPYDELHVAYGALNVWIRDHDFEVAGPVRERYLNGPDTVRSPSGYRTEIEMPIVPVRIPATV